MGHYFSVTYRQLVDTRRQTRFFEAQPTEFKPGWRVYLPPEFSAEPVRMECIVIFDSDDNLPPSPQLPLTDAQLRRIQKQVTDIQAEANDPNQPPDNGWYGRVYSVSARHKYVSIERPDGVHMNIEPENWDETVAMRWVNTKQMIKAQGIPAAGMPVLMRATVTEMDV